MRQQFPHFWVQTPTSSAGLFLCPGWGQFCVKLHLCAPAHVVPSVCLPFSISLGARELGKMGILQFRQKIFPPSGSSACSSWQVDSQLAGPSPGLWAWVSLAGDPAVGANRGRASVHVKKLKWPRSLCFDAGRWDRKGCTPLTFRV